MSSVHAFSVANLEIALGRSEFENSNVGDRHSLSDDSLPLPLTMTLETGQTFESKSDVRLAVATLCSNACRDYKTTRSTQTRLEVKCFKPGCAFHVNAASVRQTNKWVLTICNARHSCERGGPSKKVTQFTVSMFEDAGWLRLCEEPPVLRTEGASTSH